MRLGHPAEDGAFPRKLEKKRYEALYKRDRLPEEPKGSHGFAALLLHQQFIGHQGNEFPVGGLIVFTVDVITE